MAWTNHHFRQLLRLLTRRTLLYTEMYPVDVVLEAAAAPRDGPMRHETAAPRGKATGEWKPTSLADRCASTPAPAAALTRSRQLP
eukprot:scaffold27651_cov45-Phaeocystis_antarctica.AAC.3